MSYNLVRQLRNDCVARDPLYHVLIIKACVEGICNIIGQQKMSQ